MGKSTVWFPYRSKRLHKKTEGVTDCYLVRCEAIGKPRGENPYLLANEWVAASIAQFLRLPIPPFSLMKKRSRQTAMFGSYTFGDSTPSSIRPREFYAADPLVCAGILVFDIYIANSDRHRGNAKVDSPTHPTRISLFDHDRALFNVKARDGIQRLHDLTGRLGISSGSVSKGNRHVFLDVVDDYEHFKPWLNRIDAIPDWFIEDVCDETCKTGVRTSELEELKSFLKVRRGELGKIILDNRGEFTAIKTWPVVL